MMKQNATPRLWAIGSAGLALALVATAPRHATAQGAGAAPFVQNLGTQAIQAIGPAVPQSQRAAVFRKLLDTNFDVSEAARFVLGPYGRDLTPPQQREFMTLFRDSLAQAYSAKLGRYAGDRFVVTGSRPIGGEVVVSSRVDRPDGRPVQLDWHVINRSGRFLITDVAVDGVSQKAAERSQFAGIIQRNGGRPEAAIAALRQNLELQQGAGSGSSYPPSPYPPQYAH